MEEEYIEEADHIKILRALVEIPFPVGKKLLCDFLFGKYNNASIIKNNLDEYKMFGSLDDFYSSLANHDNRSCWADGNFGNRSQFG